MGGLVTLRHNDNRQELGAIACEVFPPSAITVEPALSTTLTATIPPGCHIHFDTSTHSPQHAPNPPLPPWLFNLPQLPILLNEATLLYTGFLKEVPMP